jgi:hypothetical protein
MVHFCSPLRLLFISYCGELLSISVVLVRILVISHVLLYWDLLCIYLLYLIRSGMK